MSRTHIDVNFTSDTEEQRLYKRIISTRRGTDTLSEHARNLMREALDCVTAKPKQK